MKRCDFSGVLLPKKRFKDGDEVKVMKGPFANFIATVERYETEQRIWIYWVGRQKYNLPQMTFSHQIEIFYISLIIRHHNHLD